MDLHSDWKKKKDKICVIRLFETVCWTMKVSDSWRMGKNKVRPIIAQLTFYGEFPDHSTRKENQEGA